MGDKLKVLFVDDDARLQEDFAGSDAAKNFNLLPFQQFENDPNTMFRAKRSGANVVVIAAKLTGRVYNREHVQHSLTRWGLQATVIMAGKLPQLEEVLAKSKTREATIDTDGFIECPWGCGTTTICKGLGRIFCSGCDKPIQPILSEEVFAYTSMGTGRCPNPSCKKIHYYAAEFGDASVSCNCGHTFTIKHNKHL